MTNDINNKLLDKSKEAFLMSIEVYNKPTIKYRVEGFSFFICNAWELMLKARMITLLGDKSIYYKDNPSRTISLENCVQKVFTNNKDPLRINLEKIIELRNISTHFITEEYEMVYIPLFQACVYNFIEKMQEFHNIDMTEVIPQNFLTLTVSMNVFNIDEIRMKYPIEIADKLININDSITPIIDNNNNNFAIRIDHHYFITKDLNKATTVIGIKNNSDTSVKIVKELKDPNVTHKFPCKKCINEINTRLKRAGILLNFNSSHFNLFCKYYGIKENAKLCYKHTIYTNTTYSYSVQTIDFIVNEIKKDPDNIIQNLRNLQKNKSTPGAKEF